MRKLAIWVICLFFFVSPCLASQIDGAVETPASIGAEPAQTPASQVEAEAGSEAGIRSWSPLRIFQGIASWWDNTGRLAPGAIGDTTPSRGTFSPLISKGPAIINSGFAGTISSSGATVMFTSAEDAADAGYSATNAASGLGTTIIAAGQTRYIIAWTNSTTCTVSSAPSPAWGAGTAITSVQLSSSAEVTSNGTLKRWMDGNGDEHFVGAVAIGTTGAILSGTNGYVTQTALGRSVKLDGISQYLEKASPGPDNFEQGSEMMSNGGLETVTGAEDDGNDDTWTGWTVTAAGDSVADSTVVAVRSGSNGTKALKLITGSAANASILQTVAVTAGDLMGVSVWASGDGTNKPRMQVYDHTNATFILATYTIDNATTDYINYRYVFTVPVGCENVQLILISPAGAGSWARFDDCSMRKIYNMSFLCWVKRTVDYTTVIRQYFLDRLEGTYDRSWFFRFEGNDAGIHAGQVSFGANADGTGFTSTVYSSTLPLENIWYLVGVTYQVVADGTSVAKMYINGALEGTASTFSAPLWYGTSPLRIGATAAIGSEHYHDGELGRIQIIRDLVLSDAQMLSAYQNGIPQVWPSGAILADYNWRGEFGRDLSGQGNHLTPGGGISSNNRAVGANPYIDQVEF